MITWQKESQLFAEICIEILAKDCGVYGWKNELGIQR